MFQTATSRERSPLNESSETRKDLDCRSESTASSLRSPSPIVHVMEASSDSMFKERIPGNALRSFKPTRASFHHGVKPPRSQSGRGNLRLTDGQNPADLLENGRRMMQILKRKPKGRIGAASRQFCAPRRPSRHLEEDGDEVSSSTPRIETSDRFQGESRPVEEMPLMDSGERYESKDPGFMEAEQRGQWVASETSASNSVLGARPAVEPMDYHVVDNADNFGNISAVTNARPTIHFNRSASIPDYSSFFNDLYASQYSSPVVGVPSYSDTHYRRSKKPQIEKPVLECGRTGTVANYNCSDGYGFITVKSVIGKLPINGNLYVHHSGLQEQSLTKGEEVKFDVAQGLKGREAINVSLIS